MARWITPVPKDTQKKRKKNNRRGVEVPSPSYIPRTAQTIVEVLRNVSQTGNDIGTLVIVGARDIASSGVRNVSFVSSSIINGASDAAYQLLLDAADVSSGLINNTTSSIVNILNPKEPESKQSRRKQTRKVKLRFSDR